MNSTKAMLCFWGFVFLVAAGFISYENYPKRTVTLTVPMAVGTNDAKIIAERLDILIAEQRKTNEHLSNIDALLRRLGR